MSWYNSLGRAISNLHAERNFSSIRISKELADLIREETATEENPNGLTSITTRPCLIDTDSDASSVPTKFDLPIAARLEGITFEAETSTHIYVFKQTEVSTEHVSTAAKERIVPQAELDVQSELSKEEQELIRIHARVVEYSTQLLFGPNVPLPKYKMMSGYLAYVKYQSKQKYHPVIRALFAEIEERRAISFAIEQAYQAMQEKED